MPTPLPLAAWLPLINAWTFVRFWEDKQRARRGEWRVPESDLIALALLGGTPAAFAARHLISHKTRKSSPSRPTCKSSRRRKSAH